MTLTPDQYLLFSPLLAMAVVYIYRWLDDDDLLSPALHTIGAVLVLGLVYVVLHNQKMWVSIDPYFDVWCLTTILFLPLFYLTAISVCCYRVFSRYRKLNARRNEYAVHKKEHLRPVRIWHCFSEYGTQDARARLEKDISRLMAVIERQKDEAYREELTLSQEVQQREWQARREAENQNHLQAYEAATDQFKVLVAEHLQTLTRKRSQGTYFDEYGVALDKKWKEEALYFIKNVACPKAAPHLPMVSVEWLRLIDDLVPHQSPQSISLKYAEVVTGVDYEWFVAGLLNKAGWATEMTIASGDHGADIIASKDGFRIAVQCKLYAGPVGNASVQEAHAGKGFYRCNAAIVVSKSDYTKHARVLASSLGVALMHHDDLETKISLIGELSAVRENLTAQAND